MESDMELPTSTPTTATVTVTATTLNTLSPPQPPPPPPSDGHDSNCSTPYASAPSSPGRSFPYFYSAPASPMHYLLSSAPHSAVASPSSSPGSFEFEFSSRFDSPPPEISSTADELFLNGQIRPMKLSSHLLRPQPPLSPLSEHIDDDGDDHRSSRLRDRSQRRRTRSLSPLRSNNSHWLPERDAGEDEREIEMTPSGSASSSRCSSAGRSSKRWAFLTDFLRTKSDGRSKYHKFWHHLSFSPVAAKEKKEKSSGSATPFLAAQKMKLRVRRKESPATAAAASAKRRSAHEMHYTANRAQAEEMRKKTYLPYREGLLGCLGFNSKSYGAFHGFASALNPVSSST